MTMYDVFLRSFQVGRQQWRVAAIVYFFQLCLALTLGMQVHNVLEASIGHSLELRKLLLHYDHTVMTDFLKVHGASITPLIGQLRWLVPVWLVFAVYIDAGLLGCAASAGETRARAFWVNGAQYFSLFFKIGLFFLALALLWTLALWTPVALFLEPALERFPSEKYTVWAVWSVLALYLAGLALLFLWSVLSRVAALSAEIPAGAALRTGWRLLRHNGRRLLAFLGGMGAIQLILVLVYWQLEAHGGMTSAPLVLAFFLLQQGFIFLRIQLRQVAYAGVYILSRPGV